MARAPKPSIGDRTAWCFDAFAYKRLVPNHGATVSEAGQLDDVLAKALASDGPALVEIITDAELI